MCARESIDVSEPLDELVSTRGCVYLGSSRYAAAWPPNKLSEGKSENIINGEKSGLCTIHCRCLFCLLSLSVEVKRSNTIIINT